VDTPPGLYTIRIKGRLGATALSAFPTMVPELKADETVLTGLLEDRSAVFGVLAQIEALGLELVEPGTYEHRTEHHPLGPDTIGHELGQLAGLQPGRHRWRTPEGRSLAGRFLASMPDQRRQRDGHRYQHRRYGDLL